MPRIVDHAQRRTEIASALWQVIHEQGIDGVSFRSVAQAAGISIGRVQHYFPSKDELVLDGCRQLVSAAVQNHGPDRDPSEPRSAREGLVDLLCGALADGEAFRIGASVWTAYQAKAVSNPDIAAIVSEAMTDQVDALAHLVSAAGAAAPGAEPDASDRADALRLAALSEGLTQRVLVGVMTARDARGVIRAEVDRWLPA